MEFEDFVIMGRGKTPESYMAIVFPSFPNCFSRLPLSAGPILFVSHFPCHILIIAIPISPILSLSDYPVFSFIPLYSLLLPSYPYFISLCECLDLRLATYGPRCPSAQGSMIGPQEFMTRYFLRKIQNLQTQGIKQFEVTENTCWDSIHI